MSYHRVEAVAPAIRSFVDQQSLVALATVASDGTPNVAPMHWKVWFDDGDVAGSGQLHAHDESQRAATGKATVSAWDAASGVAYQCKGAASYVTDGPHYAAAAAHMASRKPGQRPKGVVVLEVTEVYTQQPGEVAGRPLNEQGEVVL